MSTCPVPTILKQRFIELEGTSKELIPSVNPKKENHQTRLHFDNGHFLLWKGVETGFFYVSSNSTPGSLLIFDCRNGTEEARLLIDYRFGRTAVIVDVIYFPLSNSHHGVLVAVADRSLEKGDYVAYISLSSKRLLKSSYVPYPITKLCAILDGTSSRDQFLRLAENFHSGWSHIVIVGCRFGYVSLVCLDVPVADFQGEILPNLLTSSSANPSEHGAQNPVRCRKNVHLSKIFYEDQLFTFRADDGSTRCLTKENVSVSALHWNEKTGLVVIGFNFGGIMAVSLRSSKVYSLIFIDGMVQHFAFQEPEEDPRPLLYLWITYTSVKIGNNLLMCSVGFPKDEEVTKNSSEYTFLEPYISPCMKWAPDNCTRFLTMRTIFRPRQPQTSSNWGLRSCASLTNLYLNDVQVKRDSSLLFISWVEKTRREETQIHGALFDLNAFYAKRLVARIQPDSTIARQLPFFARFFSLQVIEQTESFRRNNSLLDMHVSKVGQFAPPAFLNESIDQLYYPSTYDLDLNCLSSTRVFKAKVRPLQTQLILDLAKNITKYFESPHDPARWIHSIGLANSAPANNLNEERACLLRIIVHSFFPSVISLIDSASEDNMDCLKFIQKWLFKEVEVTKAKFDELCSPLFATPPHEPSPSARGFIQHARVFFKRASIIFETLNTKISSMVEKERTRSILLQAKISKQIRLYSSSIAFALVYNLLPVTRLNTRLYEVVVDKFSVYSERARKMGRELKIHSLISEIIKSNREEEIWQGKTAQEWYPPRDFKSLLPVLLLLNITEEAKINLLGYYCLDLEAASTAFSSDVEVKYGNTPPSNLRLSRTLNNDDSQQILHPHQKRDYFSLFTSFVLQEDFSLEEMNRIRASWLEDRQILHRGGLHDGQIVEEDEHANVQNTDRLKEFSSLSEMKKCRDEFLKEEWGAHKFNDLVLKYKRYKFLLDLPPLKGDEPEFVQQCYRQCVYVRRCFPSLFKKTEVLPRFIIDRYISNVSCGGKHSNSFATTFLSHEPLTQPILPLSIKHNLAVGEIDQPKAFSRTKTISTLSTKRTHSLSDSDGEEEEKFEELPLTIATPRKRQRLFLLGQTQGSETDLLASERPSALETGNEKSPVICDVVQKDCFKPKEWDRISKITQTPLSLRRSIIQSRLPLRERESGNRTNSARAKLFRESAAAKRNEPAANPQISAAPPPFDCSSTTPVKVRGEEDGASEGVSSPAALAHPPSILRKSRLPSDTNSAKPKLRFAQALFTTEQIPSRFEKANDERKDTSFSNFAEFSLSESSPTSSRSTQQVGTGSGNTSHFGSSMAASSIVDSANNNGRNGSENGEEMPLQVFASNEAQHRHGSPTAPLAEKVGNLAAEPRVEKVATSDKAKNSAEHSMTRDWLSANLRRSTRVRKNTEHFEPEPKSPIRSRRSPSRQDLEKSPEPTCSRRSPMRQDAAQKSPTSHLKSQKESSASQTPKKKRNTTPAFGKDV